MLLFWRGSTHFSPGTNKQSSRINRPVLISRHSEPGRTEKSVGCSHGDASVISSRMGLRSASGVRKSASLLRDPDTLPLGCCSRSPSLRPGYIQSLERVAGLIPALPALLFSCEGGAEGDEQSVHQSATGPPTPAASIKSRGVFI